MTALFEADTYLIRQKVMKILGEEFHIYADDTQTNLLGFSKQKAFKLKEDIRLYEDEGKTQELLTIKARGILDFGSGYDIVDPRTGENLGGFKRKGFKSLFKDSWQVYDASGNVYAEISEDSTMLALVRRFVPGAQFLLTQEFKLSTGKGGPEVTYRQNMNPFVHKLTILNAQSGGFDPRIVAAGGILLIAIEGKQTQSG